MDFPPCVFLIYTRDGTHCRQCRWHCWVSSRTLTSSSSWMRSLPSTNLNKGMRAVEVSPNTRMWTNAQHDGRLAEYRWHPLFNAAVWLTPTTRVPCINAAKTPNPLKFVGVPQTPEPISAVSRPYSSRY